MQSQAQTQRLAGGWAVISVKDERVAETARFAASAQSALSKTAIKLVEVVESNSQVVAGTNYGLTMKVLHEGVTRKVYTIVWAKLDGSFELLRWDWQ